VDGGRIIYLLDTGKLASLKFPTLWFENTPQGKFMLNIVFGQSKYYVDSLSATGYNPAAERESTRRGRLLSFPILFTRDYSNMAVNFTRANTSQSSQRKFLIKSKKF
jgi:hypothetical protein